MKTILQVFWTLVLLASACNYPAATPPATDTSPPPSLPTSLPSIVPTLLATQPPATLPAPTQANPTAPVIQSSEIQTVFIYLVALEDNGISGEKIGCGDSLVPVEITIPSTTGVLRAALDELLSVHEAYFGESGLYNALYQSDLQVGDVRIEDGLATIQLEGRLRLGGVCDNPRVEGQLKKTALQFSTVREVAITVNGTPLEALLSGK